jgi:hypothetical protein
LWVRCAALKHFVLKVQSTRTLRVESKKLLSVGVEYQSNTRSVTAGTAYAPEGRIASRSTILN